MKTTVFKSKTLLVFAIIYSLFWLLPVGKSEKEALIIDIVQECLDDPQSTATSNYTLISEITLTNFESIIFDTPKTTKYVHTGNQFIYNALLADFNPFSKANYNFRA